MKKIRPIIAVLLMFGVIFFILFSTYYTKYINKFTDEDWQYMYKYIDDEYGNGEHFHIVSEKTDIIKSNKRTRRYRNGRIKNTYTTEGIKASIIGYFDSQDEMYAIVFSKYLNDQKGMNNVKAHEVVLTTVSKNALKDDYLTQEQKKN